jgi:hypothetical protein
MACVLCWCGKIVEVAEARSGLYFYQTAVEDGDIVSQCPRMFERVETLLISGMRAASLSGLRRSPL